MKDCWNSIGVRGDRSCQELTQHLHCRSCPVYASAARTVLDSALPDGYLSDWTRHFAEAKPDIRTDLLSLLTFRVGREWLALSAKVVWEITELRPVHSLPHRLSGIVLGLVNVRGELLVCISLGRLLDLEAHPSAEAPDVKSAQHRLMVIRRAGMRVACVADEVDGIQHVNPDDFRGVPSTVAHAATAHSRGVMTSGGRTIGVLDDQWLFDAIEVSLT